MLVDLSTRPLPSYPLAARGPPGHEVYGSNEEGSREDIDEEGLDPVGVWFVGDRDEV